MKKIIIVVLILAMILVLLVSCGGSKKQLNVYNWGEYMDPELIEMFEEEMGVDVNYKEYPTNEDLYIKLKSGTGDFDVIFPSEYMLEKMINEDMIAKINVDNLENFKYIDERFTGLAFDKNDDYSVPYFWGTLGILYNETMINEPVTSWDILWDEKYENQILMLDSQRDSMAVALKRLGYSLNSVNDDELAEAKASLIAQKPLVLSYVIDEVKSMMIQGEATLAVTWSGEAIDITDNSDDMNYAVPSEGSNLWFDVMAIPESSQNKDLALKFIDFMCRPDIALLNTEYVGYSTPNKAAYENLDEEIKSTDSYYPSDDVINNCEVFVDLGEYTNVYGDLWLEVKAAN